MMESARAEGKEVNQRIIANEVMGTVRSNFSNKLKRDSFSLEEVVKISNYLGYKVIIKGNGRQYEIKKEE